MRLIAVVVLLSFVGFTAPSKLFGQRLTDSDIRDKLRGHDSTEAEREKLLRNFGLEQWEAKSFASDDNDTNPSKVEWMILRQVNGLPTRVLFLPCRDFMYGARMLILTKAKGSWKSQSEQGFDCHYDFNVSMRVVSLTSSRNDDLLIQHACVGHGTGYVEQQAELFRVTDSKLVSVWAENDLLKQFGLPEDAGGKLSSSTFLATRPGVLEETRETRKTDEDGEPLNGTSHMDRRTFRWSEQKQTLVPSAFVRLR